MSNNQGIGEQIRTGLKGIHGAGEVIRGAALKAADDVFETRHDNAKNQAIVDKGLKDVKRADEMVGSQHGVHSTNAKAQTGTVEGMPGAHATAPGNVGGVNATGPQTGNVGVPQEQMGTSQRF